MSAVVATEEQDELRDAIRSLLEQSSQARTFIAEKPQGDWFDRDLLNVLNQELGVADLLVPEALGGGGGTVADAAVVFEELGAALAPVPFFASTALAIPALLAIGGDTAEELIASIGSGESIITIADADLGLSDDHSVEAEAGSDGHWSLTGRSGVVLEGAGADAILVVAESPGGKSLYLVDANAQGLDRTPLKSLDFTRGFAEITLNQVSAVLLGAEGEATKAVELAYDIGAVFLAAEQVGGAQRMHDIAVEYAKTRVQFDQKIGSFQQISSTLVDLLLEVEMSRSTLIRAIDAAQDYLDNQDEVSRNILRIEASMAKAMCSDAYAHVADESLHVLGGIGFTWEHDAHLYFRRAASSRQFLGSPDTHRERMVKAVGL